MRECSEMSLDDGSDDVEAGARCETPADGEQCPGPWLRRFRDALLRALACHAYRSPEASDGRETHIGRTRARA